MFPRNCGGTGPGLGGIPSSKESSGWQYITLFLAAKPCVDRTRGPKYDVSRGLGQPLGRIALSFPFLGLDKERGLLFFFFSFILVKSGKAGGDRSDCHNCRIGEAILSEWLDQASSRPSVPGSRFGSDVLVRMIGAGRMGRGPAQPSHHHTRRSEEQLPRQWAMIREGLPEGTPGRGEVAGAPGTERARSPKAAHRARARAGCDRARDRDEVVLTPEHIEGNRRRAAADRLAGCSPRIHAPWDDHRLPRPMAPSALRGGTRWQVARRARWPHRGLEVGAGRWASRQGLKNPSKTLTMALACR